MNERLPTSLTVNGKSWRIRSNVWDILKILKAFGDPELEEQEKLYICFVILYKDFEQMPKSEYEEAFKQALWFLDYGMEHEEGKRPTLVDWEQDEKLIFPAINSVAGREVRNEKYIHWWTFMSYYMEIRESLFSMVVNIRKKKANNKKLEKWESDFYKNNKKLCVIAPKLTQEQLERKEKLNKLLGG